MISGNSINLIYIDTCKKIWKSEDQEQKKGKERRLGFDVSYKDLTNWWTQIMRQKGRNNSFRGNYWEVPGGKQKVWIASKVTKYDHVIIYLVILLWLRIIHWTGQEERSKTGKSHRRRKTTEGQHIETKCWRRRRSTNKTRIHQYETRNERMGEYHKLA